MKKFIALALSVASLVAAAEMALAPGTMKHKYIAPNDYVTTNAWMTVSNKVDALAIKRAQQYGGGGGGGGEVPSNVLVLTNSSVKTISGSSITAADVGARSSTDQGFTNLHIDNGFNRYFLLGSGLIGGNLPDLLVYNWNQIEKKSMTAGQSNETLPSYVQSVATEIVRSKNCGVWDSALQVWWDPVMSNGKLTYQATTNVNLNAVN